MKNSKIGTLSLNINAPDFNYGAMLHSWAFQKYLQKKNDVEYTEIIDYTIPKVENWNRRCPEAIRPKKLRVKEIKKFLIRYQRYHSRRRKFDKFIKNQLVVSSKKYTQKTIEDANLPYDILVCESDVIWCPNMGKLDRVFYLACESMKDKKRIAYSPSMADASLTPEQENELDGLLEGISHISCRESYMVDVLEKHTEKPIEHVLDPVLLLNPEDYDSITAPRLIDEKYMLLYMPVNHNRVLLETANKFAQKKGYKILEISTKLNKKKENNYICVADAGIEEFLSALRYAEVIFSNSFHAICFSILFEKDFYAFTRKFNGKVRDICETFGLMDYYLQDDICVEKEPYDKAQVKSKLECLREKSRSWLDNALC